MFVWAKRVLLFVVTNILVLLTLSISFNLILNLLGIQLSGFEYILFFYALLGMGGAFISLWMSKFMAKMAHGVKIIPPETRDPNMHQLVKTVHRMAKQAGLKKMPEVGYYESPEVNAFATGPSKNNSLVAVSAGLLNRMNGDQVEGVLGHEIAHIANGDMVTMTLIQGIINTLVLVLARVVSSLISSQMDERAGPMVQFGLYFLLQIVFSILGSIVVNYFSRHREFRADQGGAKYAGRDKMVSALKALAGTQEYVDSKDQAYASLKISGARGGVLAALFSTHPPLTERIRRLERMG